MAHPAASVKSIFSGKVNLDPPEDLDSLDFDYDEDDSSSRFSNESLNSKNLKFFNYSTNVSINSNDSEDEAPRTDTLNVNMSGMSPSLSRNSTTSCLSTTATKDGIEGRKLHRKGPTPYSNHIIANMAKLADDRRQQLSPGRQTPGSWTPDRTPPFQNSATPAITPRDTTPTPNATDAPESSPLDNLRYTDQSQSSLRTTDAELNGERGGKLSGDVPLSTKIELLNRE